ncbi:molybdopterin-dependent oxidoreductase [Hwanghaeella sp.]|uniref:molybdopterin-dependent oxidoreductase n=1 Tax=Hwanghaeella sp. TaxID=2605943 RepID=UPI003CCBAB61
MTADPALEKGAVRTTCPYCGVGCGVLARVEEDGVSIAGDPSHPANEGRLCSKGSALDETIDLEGRLLQPRLHGAEIQWDRAIAMVADKFSQAIEEHGPDSVAFYVSGQLLTEDYYVANKLMKGFIGSANIDTNSRLCMSSSVAGHKRAFGADAVPGTYEDLELADLVVLVGSNLAWCHPVLYQRIAAAKKDRPQMRIVTVDPRRTATSDIADMELRLAPGSDVALFNGLLDAIAKTGSLDHDFLERHTVGLDEALDAAAEVSLQDVAAVTGLSADHLQAFFSAWIETEKVVTVYSQGVNQSSSGTDKVNAIINCHLATGRIGRPGMGPFSVTGQPNAMGGREVGGLANMLAAHLDIENPEHRTAVQEFWQSPTICVQGGLKAVDMFKACADGRIKALWIMSTNPAVSLPEAGSVRAAIEACPFVVVSDIMAETDTAELADLVLPAAAWGEKSGTVTNSDRTVSRQRPFLPVPGQARPDWRIICDVAAAMGWKNAFDYNGPAAIFREHAALSAVSNRFGLDFDITGLAEIDDKAYEAFQPIRWPVSKKRKSRDRFFGDGRFFTSGSKARLLAVRHRAPESAISAEYPLRLNTGRVRDHWHTMTRTGKSGRLSRHMAEPYAEINPADALRFGIAAASLVRVENPYGSIIVRAIVTDRVQLGSVFVPMHWTNRWTANGRVGNLVRAVVDPVSGQPELKASVARVVAFEAAWHGFAVGKREMKPDSAYWSRSRFASGWQVELAADKAPSDWEAHARSLLRIEAGDAITMIDPSRGIVRAAFIEDGKVAGAFFASPGPVELARSHVLNLVAAGNGVDDLLAGRPGGQISDPGATVCSCFDIGVNTIMSAIVEGGLADVEAVGEAVRAGTNCGSCRPELRALISRASLQAAAE